MDVDRRYRAEQEVYVPLERGATCTRGRVYAALHGGAEDAPFAVVCTHPWGPMGGSMDDHVVMQVIGWARKNGFATGRFNFRSGIGTGDGSVEDTVAVAYRLLEEAGDSARLLLCGYSYGSVIAAGAVSQLRAELGGRMAGLVLISPPVGFPGRLIYLGATERHLEAARASAVPVLLLKGDNDQFCSSPVFDGLVSSFPSNVDSEIVEDCDHFWFKRGALAALIEGWVKERLMTA